MIITLKEISEIIGGTVLGDLSKEITGINSLDKATNNQISYATNQKYINLLKNTSAGAVIVDLNLKNHCTTNSLVVDDAYLAFAKLTHYFSKYQSIRSIEEIQKELEKISLIEGISIAPGCYIGKNVKIGKNSIVGPNCVLEDNVMLGENSSISANVIIQKNCQIGNRCAISPGVVIGSEGFGNARDEKNQWHSIAHLGAVVIGDDVSIGANTTIDRGTIDNTEIHSGVKIDNLVHIAHNVIIGNDTAIAAKTGIAGTTIVGKRCMIGGMVGIVGHLTITDDVIVNATSTVNRNIMTPGIYTGFVPLMLHSEWKKVGIWLTKLDKIAILLKIKLKNIK